MTFIIIFLSLVPLLVVAKLTRRFGLLGLAVGLGLLALLVQAAAPDERPKPGDPCDNEFGRISEQMEGRECPPTDPSPAL